MSEDPFLGRREDYEIGETSRITTVDGFDFCAAPYDYKEDEHKEYGTHAQRLVLHLEMPDHMLVVSVKDALKIVETILDVVSKVRDEDARKT